MPLRFPAGDLFEENVIHAFIDYTIEANAGSGYSDLVAGIFCMQSPLPEMFDVDTSRNDVYFRMAVPSCFVEALPTGKDQVGFAQQLHLPLADRLRTEPESLEVDHAIVNDQSRIEVITNRQSQRSIIPEYVLSDITLYEKSRKEFLFHRDLRIVRKSFAQA